MMHFLPVQATSLMKHALLFRQASPLSPMQSKRVVCIKKKKKNKQKRLNLHKYTVYNECNKGCYAQCLPVWSDTNEGLCSSSYTCSLMSYLATIKTDFFLTRGYHLAHRTDNTDAITNGSRFGYPRQREVP